MDMLILLRNVQSFANAMSQIRCVLNKKWRMSLFRPRRFRKEKAQGNGDAILSEAPPSARSKDWNPHVSPAPNRQNIIILEWLRDSLILGCKGKRLADFQTVEKELASDCKFNVLLSAKIQTNLSISKFYNQKKSVKSAATPEFISKISIIWFSAHCIIDKIKVTIYPTPQLISIVTLQCPRQITLLSFL